MNEATFQQLNPLLEIDGDCLISKRGDITMAYEVYKPELFHLSAEELEQQHQRWVAASSTLPYGALMHQQDWYTQAKYIADPDKIPDHAFLAQCSDQYHNERPYRYHRCFCFLTRRFAGNLPPTSALSSLFRRGFVPEYLRQPAQLQQWIEQCQQFVDVLTENGMLVCRKIKAEELTGTTHVTGLLQRYHQLTPPFMTPELRDVSLKPGIQVGDQSTVCYTLADAQHLPSQCSPGRQYDKYSTEATSYPIGFASPLGLLLDADHIYNQYLFLDDPRPTLKKLERRRRRARTLSGQVKENAVTHEAIEQFQEQLAKGGRLVKAHFNVFAWTDSQEKVPQLKNKITAGILQLGAMPHLETVGAPQIWWAGQPGNAGDMPINETFDSTAEAAVCFFIPESNGRSSVSPFGIRMGERLTGTPLHVDLSDEPMRKGWINNCNKAVVGGSGSGKSFKVCHMLRSYFEQGAHVTVADVGDSYQGLCELVGGYHFAYTEKDPMGFNPFWLPLGKTLDTEKKESIKALLLTLWKKSDETLVRSEYISLSNALQGYYDWLAKHSDEFPCFDSFYDYLRNVFIGQLEADGVREKDFDVANFLYVLRPYYRGGEYDFLLNARTQLDLLHQRMIVFELDAIKDHPILFPVVTIVIMEVFIAKMRQLKGVKKIIVIEEAWKALAKEGMSEYIRYLFKTVRKHNGEAIVVTQDIEDIIDNPIVKNTILNNADCKILLDQSKFMHRFGELQELLGLTEKDKTLLLSLNKANEPGKNYKEVFIALGNNHSRVYRTEVSLEEYLVYTTKESEKVKVSKYAQVHGGIRKGVAALAADIRAGVVQLLLAAAFICCFLLLPNGRANAQFLDIVEEAIKEALETADLKIQRLQTQTLLLQNAQKELENTMQDGLLTDITGWVRQEQELYSEYYNELWQAKAVLTDYSKVRTLVKRQMQIVKNEQQAFAVMRQDPHFSAAEIAHMANVYNGILSESVKNTQELALAIQSLVTQMDDAGRLRLIDETADRIDRNYEALSAFTQQNKLLSLQRARDERDIQTLKTLYGLP